MRVVLTNHIADILHFNENKQKITREEERIFKISYNVQLLQDLHCFPHKICKRERFHREDIQQDSGFGFSP